MKLIRDILDKSEKLFVGDGPFKKLYPLFEAFDTFIFTPKDTAHGGVHARDNIDLKRLMSVVVIALLPCMIFGMYNVGLQANGAMLASGIIPVGWRADILAMMGIGFDPTNIIACFLHGALYFIPIYLVTNMVGGFWEVLFATVRKHEVNEGMLVTGVLFPLILPPTIPLWQVAVGISFGVVVGKEIFGGTGKNFLNPALVSRAFLFFAYPAEISGDAVWTAVDGFTGATALGNVAISGMDGVSILFQDAFLGFTAGSIGETSTLACIFGAGVLIFTGIGSWRIMISVVVGMALFAILLNVVGSSTNPLFAISPLWHLVLGGFAFGTVFMATDPVSASMTFKGQYFYGLLIGVMVILVRVINPAFPEGMMLAILFGNMCAPLIDYFVVEANIKRRGRRYAK